jgi:hypothetical protein
MDGRLADLGQLGFVLEQRGAEANRSELAAQVME